MANSASFDLALALFASYISYLWLSRRSKAIYLPLPPSPRGWPLIGNLLEFPTVYSWKGFHKWCQELDTGVLYLNLVGNNVIVLDSYEDCVELLEKRSSLYSGRMRLPMVNELMGFSFHFAGTDYGDTWRQRRRLMHNDFHPRAIKSFQLLELRAARKFLSELRPRTDIVPAVKQVTGQIIMSIAYGLDVEKDDPYITAAEDGVKLIEHIKYPGAFLVDILPILKYVPEWMPGASFKRKAREWRAITEKMVNLPFEECVREIESGDFQTSFASRGLQNAATKGGIYTAENIKAVSATLYVAGAETTFSTMGCCMSSLLDHPDAMTKIQAEIDLVTGGTRLPDFGDEDCFPYLQAFIKEVMRSWPLLPLGVPHYLAVEDEYKGFRIPAKSNIIPNTWAILHNEEVFPEPFTFNPDRFLSGTADELKVRNAHVNAAWGYGRRICPGRYMASASMWITLATVLAVYDVFKPIDEDGNIIEPSHEPASMGVLVSPPHFQCSFTPRSRAAEILLELAKEIE